MMVLFQPMEVNNVRIIMIKHFSLYSIIPKELVVGAPYYKDSDGQVTGAIFIFKKYRNIGKKNIIS